MDNFEGLSDHFILRMYEFIRNEVLADASVGTRLADAAGRRRADELRKEIDRRGLFCKPIDWSEPRAKGNDICETTAEAPKTTSI